MRYFHPGFTIHPPLFVGWNQNDKSDSIVLTGGLLTASCNATQDGAVRATLLRNADKWYAELNFTSITGGSSGGGFANGATTLQAIAAVSTGSFIQYRSGNVYKNGSAVFSNGSMAGGGILRLCYDGTAHLAWLAFAAGVFNGNAAFDPAAGTGGQDTSAFDSGGLYPAAALTVNGDICVLNAGATSFTYGAPSGFNPWNG